MKPRLCGKYVLVGAVCAEPRRGATSELVKFYWSGYMWHHDLGQAKLFLSRDDARKEVQFVPIRGLGLMSVARRAEVGGKVSLREDIPIVLIRSLGGSRCCRKKRKRGSGRR